MRWRIAILASAAIAISYLDRQTLPVAVKAISGDIPLSNEQFSSLQSAFLFAYALMYAGGGKVVDLLGTRRGFTVAMLFWSLACASHAVATGFVMLAVSRFLLGVGEGAGFPASTRVVAEWFPVQERATAMGIINAGTAVGGIVAPPLIAAILGFTNWRWIFVVTGGFGLLWVVWWRRSCSRSPEAPATDAVGPRTPFALDSSFSCSRNMGIGERQISQRCGLVLLSLLASEIPLRRTRLRHKGNRLVCVDAQRRGWNRLSAGWRILELFDAPSFLDRRCTQTGSWARARH